MSSVAYDEERDTLLRVDRDVYKRFMSIVDRRKKAEKEFQSIVAAHQRGPESGVLWEDVQEAQIKVTGLVEHEKTVAKHMLSSVLVEVA